MTPGPAPRSQQRRRDRSSQPCGVCAGDEPGDHGTGLRLVVAEPRQDPGIKCAEGHPGTLASVRQTVTVCLGHQAPAGRPPALLVDLGHVGGCLPLGLIRATRDPPVGRAAHRDAPSTNSVVRTYWLFGAHSPRTPKPVNYPLKQTYYLNTRTGRQLILAARRLAAGPVASCPGRRL